MRRLRLVCALLLVAGLAILPVSAAFAMTQGAGPEPGMMSSGGECPCCQPAGAGGCALECCHMQALAPDGVVTARSPAARFVLVSAEPPAALPSGPDPPPPRA